MKETIVQISKRLESLTKIYGEKPAVVIGLYISTLFLIWFLPDFLSPELFSATDLRPSIILDYGGIYLLNVVFFALSTVILFNMVVNKGRAIISCFTTTLFLIVLLFSGLLNMEQITQAFYIRGLEYFGITPFNDAIISAVITFPALALLSMSMIIPLILLNRYITMKRPNITLFLIGTILFPFLMTAEFTNNIIHTGSHWISLTLSISSIFLLGLVGAVVISVPLIVPGLMKKNIKEDKCRNTLAFGLFFACIVLIWVIPGYLEPGFFISGNQPDVMVKPTAFIYISLMLRYAWIIILLPVLFGCSAALLYEIVGIEKELLNQSTGFAIAISAGVLVLISLVPDILAERSTLSPPFYIPGISSFGYLPITSAILSLMVFLPQLALAALGIVTPALILKSRFPLKKTVFTLIITGFFVFPIMMLLTFGTNTKPGLLSIIVLELQGFFIGAIIALIIYGVATINEKLRLK